MTGKGRGHPRGEDGRYASSNTPGRSYHERYSKFVRILRAYAAGRVVAVFPGAKKPSNLQDTSIILCDEDKREANVVVARGPLRDVPGILQERRTGPERVVLLMEFMQRRVRVEMPASYVGKLYA